jgi:hypothetical protein
MTKWQIRARVSAHPPGVPGLPGAIGVTARADRNVRTWTSSSVLNRRFRRPVLRTVRKRLRTGVVRHPRSAPRQFRDRAQPVAFSRFTGALGPLLDSRSMPRSIKAVPISHKVSDSEPSLRVSVGRAVGPAFGEQRRYLR